MAPIAGFWPRRGGAGSVRRVSIFLSRRVVRQTPAIAIGVTAGIVAVTPRISAVPHLRQQIRVVWKLLARYHVASAARCLDNTPVGLTRVGVSRTSVRSNPGGATSMQSKSPYFRFSLIALGVAAALGSSAAVQAADAA